MILQFCDPQAGATAGSDVLFGVETLDLLRESAIYDETTGNNGESLAFVGLRDASGAAGSRPGS